MNAPLTDPASPSFGVLSTAVAGALPLIDASRMPPEQRRIVHFATAVLSGAYTAVIVGGRHKKLIPLKVAAGLVTAGAAMRFADAGDAFEARMEQRLRRAGSRYPRVWMAAGSAAVTFAGFLTDRVAAREGSPGSKAIDQGERVRPVSTAVCALVEGLLGATDVPGAETLHAQLHSAQEVYWTDGFTAGVYFRVPSDLPRAVPHEQVFPVRGLFSDPDGSTRRLFLQISNGKLDYFGVEAADLQDDDHFNDLIDAWPDPSKVAHVLDAPDGTTRPTG